MSKDISNTFDALVVGSGLSGGYIAKELCERGWRVLLIERGRPVEHITDYTTALTPPWELPHRGRAPKSLLEDYPVTARVYNKVSEYTAHFYTPDRLYPYQEDARFDWIRGYQLGGKSLTWGRIALRFSDLDFEANAREGVAIDWPIRYRDLAPWYDRAERFVGIAGTKEGLPYLPDGIFQPPMPMTCVELAFKEKLKESFPHVHVIPARQAHLTQPTEEQLALGRGSCQFRNQCSRGCPYGAYFSTQSASLPAAKRTQNLSVLTHAVVSHVVYDDTKQRAIGLEIIDANTKEKYTVLGHTIFLNASTLGTTQILMNSISKRFPHGMGNDSGVLGHYLMDHHFGAGATGITPEHSDKLPYGRRPNGFYIPRYQNMGQDKRPYLRGFGYEGDSKRPPHLVDPSDFGADMKTKLSTPGPWQMSMQAFAETLPYADNTVKLHLTEKDSWGLPLLIMNARFQENEAAMRNDMKQDAANFLEAAGFRDIHAYDEIRGFGRCIHEMGTARMGHSPKDSVLNRNNQVWGAPNVFVTDGAAMTSSACVNPSLTYLAMAGRAAEFAYREKP